MTDAPPPPAPDHSAQPSQPPAAQPNPYAAQPNPYAPAPTQKTNVLAIVSLVLSILWISIPGVICGHIALSQVKKTGDNGRGLAIAGLIVGYVGILGGILFALFWIGLVAAAGFNDYSTF